MQERIIPNEKSEILEPLHVVAAELMEVERRGKPHTIEYTRLDVIAATATFINIMVNRKVHDYTRQRPEPTKETIIREMEGFTEEIANIVYKMTGVNLNEKGTKDDK